MPALTTVVARRMQRHQLAPADWLAKERYPRGGGIDRKRTWSRELREYAALAEQLAFRKRVGAVLADHCYWGIEPVRTPVKLAFAASRDRLVTFLMGCEVLGSDPDSGAYLVATWTGRTRATSLVASFLFNDVMPQDAKPGDFVVEALSIRDALERGGDPAGRPAMRSAPCADLARRYRRAIWLAQIFQGPDWDGFSDDVDELARPLRDAAPRAAYERERKAFATRPDVAAYWLLALAALDDRAALTDALARTADSPHAAIRALRTQLAPITRGVPVLEAGWKKLGRGDVKALRAAIGAMR